MIQAIDNGVQRACGSRALTVTGDKDFSHELVKTVAMSPEHRELIPALSARIAEKYSLIGRYAPEVMLLCVVGSYGAQVALVFSKLKQFEDRQTAERAKTRTL